MSELADATSALKVTSKDAWLKGQALEAANEAFMLTSNAMKG